MVTFMSQQAPTQIRVRPETRQAIDRICQERGWTITEAIDRAVKAFQKGESKPKPHAGAA